MSTPVLNLSSSDVEQAPGAGSSQSPVLSLSSSDVEEQGKPTKGPVNPYADMSKVAGADPGMAAPSSPAPVPEALKPYNPQDSVTGAGIVKMFGMDPSTGLGKMAAQAGQQGVDRSNEYLSGKPQAEHVIQDVDPVFGSMATGAYEAGAGVKDFVKAGGESGENGEFFNAPKIAKAANRTIQGTMTAGAPEFGLAATMAPIKTAASYFAGVLAGQGAEATAKKLGMSPEAQEFANTIGFFIPTAFHTVTQLQAGTGETTARIPDPETGGFKDVPVKVATAGGRGFGVGVGRGEDGGVYVGGRVGPFSGKAKFGGDPAYQPGYQGPRQIAPSEPEAPPSAPPTGAQVQRQAQAQTIKEIAISAADINQKATEIASGNPPPPPPKIPSPAGMDDGALTQQTVEQVGQAIHMMPEEVKPKGILEAVGNLAKWMFGKKTFIGPDGKITSVDSPKAAQGAAVGIVNDEVDRRTEKAQGDQKAKENALKQQQEDAKTAQDERDEKITPTEKSTGNAPTVQIPEESPQVQKARSILASAPDHLPAEKLDALVRSGAMLTKPVRDAIVQQHIADRANKQEDQAQEVMQGAPTEPGRSRQELQKWADGVVKGEHPFVHIPNGNDFKPAGVDDLERTPVKGAGAFSGTYYHVPEITNADIRKAARDKKDPQASLDALVERWKGGGEKPLELTGNDVEHDQPSQASEAVEKPLSQSPGETVPGLEGKKVQLNLSDSSRVGAQHRLVERGDLVASHSGTSFEQDSRYPKGVQERSYHSSKDEQMKVRGQQADFRPELVTNTDTTGATGPMVVTKRAITLEDGTVVPKGTVLGGNSRAMTLEGVYTNGAPASYHAAIDENGKSYGFPDSAIKASGLKQPVHVLEVEPPTSIADLHRLGSLLNKPLTQSLDSLDKAVSLSKALSPETQQGIADMVLQTSSDDKTATLNDILGNPKTGRQVVKMLQDDGIITERNVGDFVDPSTKLLTQPARNQLGNAMLATILNNRDLMEKTPYIVKQKMLGSIGAISTLLTRDDGYNIGNPLREAARQYGELARGNHISVADGLKQQGMFGADRGPVVEALIKKLDEPIQATRDAFNQFAIGAAMASGNGGSTLPGLMQVPEAWDDFNLAFGTELTKDQFDKELKLVKETPAPKFEAPVTETKPASAETKPADPETVATPDETKPLAKGDKVTYKTNKGKERTGEIAWTDGTKARIKDGGSEVTKPVAEIQRVAGEPVAAVEKPTKVAPKDENLAGHIANAIETGKAPKSFSELKRLTEEFDGKPADQLRMKDAQEAYEVAVNRIASGIVTGPKDMRWKFDRLVQMYESQPNLSIRTSNSVSNQAYSTPLPLAFMAEQMAGMTWDSTVYEPTAGNGSLLIGANPDTTLANELDQARADALDGEGFAVTKQDASTWTPTKRFDVVIANPPFAKLAGPVSIDNYSITRLDHLIAAKALGVMKDNGKAAIIIAAGDREKPGEVTNAARPFFNWLYSHHNVVSDFELNGELYSRQGASYPVRVIAIDGRARTANVSPTADQIQRLNTWGEVYEKASEHLGANLEGQRPANNELDGSVREQPAEGSTGIRAEAGSVPGRIDSAGPGASGQGSSGSLRPTSVTGPVQHTGTIPDPGVGSPDITVRPDGDVALSDRLAEGEPGAKAVRRGLAKPDGRTANDLAAESNQFQDPFTPFSEKKDVAVMAPKAMVASMQRAMQRVADSVGDIDQWVSDELGYPDVETLHKGFMGLQVDAVANAIFNIRRGKSIIIADQTGVGKGRQAAAIIRWSELHGHTPIFITAKDQLFTDMQGDLHDIGSGHTITPLLFNADATITDPLTDRKIYGNNGAMRPVFERIMETGKLPAGRNAVYLTYSQINTPNRQQSALKRLAANAVFILDESHNGGGESNTGEFLQELMESAKGAAFLSATWAKRPDNLPLYAGKTDISIAIPDREKITSAITAGGAPLQAVVSSQLADAGQLVRRERSFDGIDFPTTVDEKNAKEHERISDKVTEVLRGILDADHMYHLIDFERIQKELAKAGKSGGRKTIPVQHMEFSSVVHNLVKQLLLAIKAEDSAQRIIAAINEGKKPVFALENTMGSFLDGYVDANDLKDGDSLHQLDYSRISHRALERTRYYRETDEEGTTSRVEVPLEHLSPQVRAAYDAAQSLIDNLDVDLPVSPIDYIRNKIEQAGHRVAEITGRTLRIDYSGETPRLSKVPTQEKKDRVQTASKFNNGGIDALIMNAAGSTGISLHASEKFKDQRQRLMIMGQPAGDVNIVMQMLGRINRTGQVKLPEYNMLAAALPAEQRPAINLAKKMKSLNANTSSNTRSATSVQAVDLFNKYGDDVVGQYMVDNPEMQRALGIQLEENKDGKAVIPDGLAMKATGRSALLTVKDQRVFSDAITEAYTNYIDYLDETGQNDLEPRTYDFDAKETGAGPKIIYEGTDPSSPFGEDAHYGQYSIKRQGKPYTPEQVEDMLAETFGPEAMQQNPKVRDTLAARAIAHELEEHYKNYLATLTADHALVKAGLVREHGRSILDQFRVGTGVLYDLSGDEYNGIITKIEGAKKIAGNPYAPSSLNFTIAINGPQQKVRVPGSQIKAAVIRNLGRNASVKELFKDHFGDSRQSAGIITGNLLGAYGNFEKGTRGRIISFTMNDGSTRMGILMPRKFDPSKDITKDYAMRLPEGAKHFLEHGGEYLQSPGGDVGVFGPGRRNGDGDFEIRTKVSKVAGGKFFLDPDLRALVVGNDFASQNGLMKATIRDGQELRALKIIMQKTALYPSPTAADQARTSDEKAKADLEKPEPPKPSGGARGNSTFSMMGMNPDVAKSVVQDVTEFAKKAAPATMDDLLKAAQLTTRSMKQAGREIVAALYPRALADEDAKDIMGRGIGHPALTLYRAGQLMDGIQKMFVGMPETDQVEFVDRIQKGKEQPTPDLQKAADIIKSVLDGQRIEEVAAINLGRKKDQQIELTDKDNYFPNRYKVAPGNKSLLTEEEQIARIGNVSKRPLEGSKAFLKQQKYTLKEAMKDGGKPLGTPVEMVMRRLQEGAKFVAAKYIMHSYRESGIVTFLKKGKPLPDGYVRINDKIAKVWRPVETEEGSTMFKETGEWVGDKDALRLLNNYLSRDVIRGTAVGQGLVKLKNITTEIRLGFSPFHYGTITFQNLSSALNVGLDKLYNGGLRRLDGQAAIDGLADIGASLFAPYTAVRAGGQMVQYARNPDEFLESPEGKKFAETFPDFPHLQRLLFEGGLRWGQADVFKQSIGNGFLQEISSGHLGAATLKVFPWLTHVIAKPLFEHYIPRSKWNFAVRMLSAKLDQYSYAIATGQMTETQVARDVVSATENRFGEFNFDNLFWNNSFKTINQCLFRSVSWKAGSWLSVAKAGREQFTSQMFNDHIYEQVADEARKGDQFRDFTKKLPQLGTNAGGIISMIAFATVMGSVIARLSSGKWPWEWGTEDHAKLGHSVLGATAFEAMHPRTGHADPHGEPVRITFPTDIKDYEHASTNPGGYIKGSTSDMVNNGWDTLINRDAFGNYVFNPNDPGWTKFTQGLEYNAKGDFLPMSVANFRDQYGPQDTTTKLEKFSGVIGGAPKGMDRSVALDEALARRTPHNPMTPEQVEAKDHMEGKPTHRQVLQAAREKRMDYLDKVVLHELSYTDAKKVFEMASPAEQDTLRPIMRKKQENAIKAARRR